MQLDRMQEPRRGRSRALCLGLALAAFHLVLLTRIYPLGLALSADPLIGTDYALHSTRAIAAGAEYLPHGRLFGLDPFHACGQVASTVHFLDNKLGELAVGVLGPLLGPGRAFNIFVFLAFATVPLALIGAARLLRQSWQTAILAGWLASLAFHGAPYTANWQLFGGYGFILCSAYAPLAAAALARHIEDATWRSGLALFATAPLFYAHGLMPPMTALLGLGLVPSAVRAGPRRLAITLAPVAGIVIVNLPWLLPLLADWGELDGEHVGAGGGGGVPLAGLARRLMGPHFYALSLPLVAGSLGLARLWRTGRRGVAAAFGLGSLAVLVGAYEGGRSAFVAAMVEPPRLKVTLPLVLAVPGAVALRHWGGRALSRWGVRRVAFAGGLFLVLTAHLTLMPLATRAFGTAQLHADVPPDAAALLDRVAVLGDPAGRIAFEETGPKPVLGLYLGAFAPARSRRPWTGGPYYRAITKHRAAQLANGKIGQTPIEDLSDDDIARWLDLFDVTGVAVTRPETVARFRALPHLVTEVEERKPYVLFTTARAANALLEGEGTVAYDYDRVTVTPGNENDVVLKFHWNHRLHVDGAEVLREEVEGAPVGFVRVRGHGGRTFDIVVRGWY